MTSSGRRVKKRILDEYAGTLPGSSKTKKPKIIQKISKKKSSKAKTSRPQRLAACNARNMLSKISGTSSDGEDEYDSVYDSSDSDLGPQDLNIQNKNYSDWNFQNMHQKSAREEDPSSNELEEEMTKPSPFSESQSNVKNKPRLVLKFTIRDSKKQVPPEDTEHKRDEHDLANPASALQNITEEKRNLKLSTGPPSTLVGETDVGRSQDKNENADMGKPESAKAYLEGSADDDDEIRWGEVKMRTSRHPRSGDLLPVDASAGLDVSADDHRGKGNSVNEDITPENGIPCAGSRRQNHGSVTLCDNEEHFETSALENLNSDKELAESSLVGEDKVKFGAATASFKDNLDKGCDGASASDKCVDDASETNGVSQSNHSHEKENGPHKPTKIRIRTKTSILADPRNPSKIKFVGPAKELTSPRDNLTHVEDDPITEVAGASGDTCRLNSSRLSFKLKTDLKGFDGDLEEQISNTHYHRDSVIGFPETVTDVVRRTRSFNMKATSRELSMLNHGTKARGNHQTVGTLRGAEEYSRKVYSQLDRKSRSSRNPRTSFNTYDRSSSAQGMANHPVGKLSWLMLSEYEEGYRYIPQLDDEVIYLRQVIYILLILVFGPIIYS